MAIIGTTNVGKYPKPHGSQGSGGTTIWRGSIKNTDLPGTMGIGSISAEKGFIGDLTGNTLTYNEGNFTYLFAQDGTVKIIRGDELRYKTGKIDDFAADTISAGKIKDVQELTVEGKAWIDELNSRTITTDYLTVTKQAHFFELIIDKIRSVGGTLILTQANCIADYVKPCDSNGEHMPKIMNEDDDYVEDLENPNVRFFDVYWTAEDLGTGRINTNDWIEGDQAYCQSFNNVTEGANYDVSNKYYWRLVTDVLDDCYMNLRTGAELTLQEAPSATVNKVTINSPRILYHDNLNNEIIVSTGWNTATQSITGVQTGVTWTPSSGGASSVTQGTMQTVNTIFGIQLTPIADTKLINAVPEKFILDTDIVSQGSVTGGPARLNIGIYYQDGTSEYFAAPAKATNHYEYLLNKTLDEEHSTQDNPVYYSATNSPIQVVVITNADEVEWHLVHGIRLSNTDMDIDTTFDPDREYVSVPSAGDNIAQLGYRSSGSNDPNIDRGNAIILAAYKTPDRGTGQVGSYKQYPIKPPSYAQYVAIGSQGPAGPQGHYYDLAYYRHTSMDANGSRFIGNFYTTGGTDIETMIQTGGADLYQLFTAYCRNYNANPHIQYPNTNWDWIKASTNMPGGIAYTYEGHASVPITKQQGETDEQAIARVGASLTFSDYSWIERPGSTGTPGGHWVNAYKNVTSTNTPPSPPNDNGVPITIAQIKAEEDLGHDGWNGWRSAPQTLPVGYFTWMSQAFVNGNGSYDLWETAVRLTGADGTDGTDGNDIEFIYYRNNGDVDGDPLTPPAPPNGSTYRDDWPATYNGSVKTSDHETITVGGIQYTWYDNPQGVGDYPNDPNAYLYEYMSQRIRRNGTWSDYTNPVVWSNWGKKGQDGDGYEYIFKLYSNPQSSWTGQANPANWNSSSAVDERGHYFDDDEYLGPTNQGWKDDPQDLSETYAYEYCSMRKKIDGSWNSFSTPALWAHWSAPGSQGPTGPQGPGGAAGRMYILADAGSQAYYSISLSIQNEIVTGWTIQLRYNIYKSEGLSTTAMTQSEIIDAGIRPYALIKKTNAPSDSYIWYRFDITTENNIGLCTLTYNRPSSGWTDTDVQLFVTNHQSIRVALLPNNSDHYSENASVLSQKYDENTLPFQLSNNAQWITYAGDLTLPESDRRRYPSIKGLVTGYQANSNHITQLNLSLDGIQGQVTQLNTDLHGPQGFQSQLNQQAGSINLMAGEISGIQSDLTTNYATKGYVGVQTNAVTLGVQNALYDTGIDITSNKITLKADKVTFTNSIGTVSNKIWIDPTTGTLHAVDGYFSGNINATGKLISKNETLWNEIRIDGEAGHMRMFGPDHVEYNNSTGQWVPASDAQQYEIYSVNFETDQAMRMAVQYIFSKLNYIQTDAQNGIMFVRCSDISKAYPYEILRFGKSELSHTYWQRDPNNPSTVISTVPIGVEWDNIIADHNVFDTNKYADVNLDFKTAKKENGPYLFDIYGIFVWKGSYDATWYIPDPAHYEGKRVVFKSMGGSLTLHSGLNTNTWFVEYNSNSAFYSRSIGNHTREYFSDGDHWIEIASS